MSEAVAWIFGLVLGVTATWFVFALGDSGKRIACAKEHNVYECELRVEAVPVLSTKSTENTT
jgi:hypothetical protein